MVVEQRLILVASSLGVVSQILTTRESRLGEAGLGLAPALAGVSGADVLLDVAVEPSLFLVEL